MQKVNQALRTRQGTRGHHGHHGFAGGRGTGYPMPELPPARGLVEALQTAFLRPGFDGAHGLRSGSILNQAIGNRNDAVRPCGKHAESDPFFGLHRRKCGLIPIPPGFIHTDRGKNLRIGKPADARKRILHQPRFVAQLRVISHVLQRAAAAAAVIRASGRCSLL
ncbi:hypothetical protein SDC9_194993 [bioreactor metagenome]|uniref:Uncharacterized protein n=1 Tax=bioreactor metagenome TaxID=1076179 RepID=A0A645I7U1_9ZZZZ